MMPPEESASRDYLLISADDHLIEPPDMFEGRLPKKLQAHAPRVVEVDAGEEVLLSNGKVLHSSKRHQVWEYEQQRFAQIGLNATAGRDKDDYADLLAEPSRFDEMRPGCFEIEARIRDMDLGGIWASINFPSQLAGFCGSVFSRSKDVSLGIAVTRAWNDWLYEAWWSPHPERIVPMGITWLANPNVGGNEIRRNAARGFVAVTLPESPHNMGLPSIFSGYWDPILAACQDTDTAICLHVGSSGGYRAASDAPPVLVTTTLFPVLSLAAATDWVWSGVPSRFPELKVVMSEGGIGWVPMLLDRLEYIMEHSAAAVIHEHWSDKLSPVEILKRNFYYCMIDDPSLLPIRERIGVDRIMVEVDYPHSDSTWPLTQQLLKSRFAGVPPSEVSLMTHGNAARVFRHPLPTQ